MDGGPFNGYLPFGQHQQSHEHQHHQPRPTQQQPQAQQQQQQQQQQPQQPQQHHSQQQNLNSFASQADAEQHHHHHQQQQQAQQQQQQQQQKQQQQTRPHPQLSPSHTTLPPLQNQGNGYASFNQLPFAHIASQSHAPAPPTSSSIGVVNTNAYSQQPGTMLPPFPYGQQYGMSQSMGFPSATATSAAPAGLPTIRPMPPGGVSGPMNGAPNIANANHLSQQSTFLQNDEAPSHVVGAQGRRGILPTAPGRPNPAPQGSGVSIKSLIPQKDADGKFPCPHCNKTYLHAKHLKRHMLRHTGDRPYQCHLCEDTFSRSDILKRHFQKCSIRRGNPTGANHLAHQRRNTNGTNRLSVSHHEGPAALAGLIDTAAHSNTSASPNVHADMSARSSRANSLISPGAISHRNSIAGLGILPSNVHSNEQVVTSAGYQPGLTAYPMQNASNAGPMQSTYAFSNAPPMNGHAYNPQQPVSFLGQASSRFNSNHSTPHPPTDASREGENGSQAEWNRMFSADGQDGFVGGQPANASSELDDMKSEYNLKSGFDTHHESNAESFMGNLYNHPRAFGSLFSGHDRGNSLAVHT